MTIINLQFVLLEAVVSRDSAVGIATHYRLHGPGIESRCWREFSHPSRQDLGPTQPPTHWVPGLSGSKAAGACRFPPNAM
jgi:hypothetical protein